MKVLVIIFAIAAVALAAPQRRPGTDDYDRPSFDRPTSRPVNSIGNGLDCRYRCSLERCGQQRCRYICHRPSACEQTVKVNHYAAGVDQGAEQAIEKPAATGGDLTPQISIKEEVAAPFEVPTPSEPVAPIEAAPAAPAEARTPGPVLPITPVDIPAAPIAPIAIPTVPILAPAPITVPIAAPITAPIAAPVEKAPFEAAPSAPIEIVLPAEPAPASVVVVDVPKVDGPLIAQPIPSDSQVIERIVPLAVVPAEVPALIPVEKAAIEKIQTAEAVQIPIIAERIAPVDRKGQIQNQQIEVVKADVARDEVKKVEIPRETTKVTQVKEDKKPEVLKTGAQGKEEVRKTEIPKEVVQTEKIQDKKTAVPKEEKKDEKRIPEPAKPVVV